MSGARFRRDPGGLEGVSWDLIVVGGGIVGACVAWDAAMRGLKTALVERGDFGGGASANCLKIVHGGLRYLQHLDIRRMRESIVERSAWLRNAPHLVEPLPVLMPVWEGQFPPRAVFAGALAANALVSVDRNRGMLPERRLSAGRLLSREDCVRLAPPLDVGRLAGAALFHDAIMYSPERLVLEVIEAASDAGATVVNHAEAGACIPGAGKWMCVRVSDRLGGGTVNVRGRTVVNATGSSAGGVAGRLLGRVPPGLPRYSVALNFVTKLPAPNVCYAISGGAPDGDRVVAAGSRQLFVVPWRGQTLVGTAHLPYEGEPEAFSLSEAFVDAFLAELRGATPSLPLRREDIVQVHTGLLPLSDSSGDSAFRLLKSPRLLHHAPDGMPGVFSVVSIKYTTARRLAQQTVDAVFRYIGRTPPPCRTSDRLLPGGSAEPLDLLRRRAMENGGASLPADVLEHLVRTYGSRVDRVLDMRHTQPDWSDRVVPAAPVIRAQLAFGIATEMAWTPDDLLVRRTELGPRGLVDRAAAELARAMLKASGVTVSGE